MKYFLDTNILLRLVEDAHVQHKVAMAALVKLRKKRASFYVTTQNISEFWNVCTRPIENNGLGLSVQAAAFHLKRLEWLCIRLVDNEQVYLHWARSGS